MPAAALRIGRYLPLRRLGRGKLIETFHARLKDASPSEKASAFVLKVLRAEACGPAVIARFLDTMRVLRWTSLPGLPSLVDIGEAPGPVFAAFEFNAGVNLAQLRAQSVPPGGLMDIRLVGLLARKLAERLGPLHAQPDGPRVHGALSPGNVLVKPSGDVLLLDCGIAESLRAEGTCPSDNWQYAAPELLQGQPAQQSSDFYAVGALLYYLYFGRPPFAADTPAALLARIKEGQPDFTGIHPSIASCIARMLSYEAAARPKSSGEIMRQISVALLSAQAVVARAVTPPAPDTVVPEPPRPSTVAPEATVEAVVMDDSSLPDDENNTTAVRALVSAAQRQARIPDPRGAISADDPDVGVVYDDDDEEDEIVVGPDGKVTRRRRRRAIRLLAWTKSELARKLFRYAWVPLLVGLVVGGVEGYFFLRSWRAARADSSRKEMEASAEAAKLEAAKPRLEKKPEIPAGHLVLKISPPGAIVWIDGVESGTAPNTMLTKPGAHRLVITASGYRMLRDVVDTTKGVLFEREMVPAVFPLTGAVGINVACTTEGKYPVFIDGKEIGAFCPIAGVRLDPGKHMVGIFVIPENRIWTLDRDIVAEKPHRVQFNY
jgi:serine/threonine protein kinase